MTALLGILGVSSSPSDALRHEQLLMTRRSGPHSDHVSEQARPSQAEHAARRRQVPLPRGSPVLSGSPRACRRGLGEGGSAMDEWHWGHPVPSVGSGFDPLPWPLSPLGEGNCQCRSLDVIPHLCHFVQSGGCQHGITRDDAVLNHAARTLVCCRQPNCRPAALVPMPPACRGEPTLTCSAWPLRHLTPQPGPASPGTPAPPTS